MKTKQNKNLINKEPCVLKNLYIECIKYIRNNQKNFNTINKNVSSFEH